MSSDEVEKLHQQLVAAGVTGMRYHRSPDGWGSSISIPRDQADKVLALWGCAPPPEAEQFYARCREFGRRIADTLALKIALEQELNGGAAP